MFPGRRDVQPFRFPSCVVHSAHATEDWDGAFGNRSETSWNLVCLRAFPGSATAVMRVRRILRRVALGALG